MRSNAMPIDSRHSVGSETNDGPPGEPPPLGLQQFAQVDAELSLTACSAASPSESGHKSVRQPILIDLSDPHKHIDISTIPNGLVAAPSPEECSGYVGHGDISKRPKV